jgi:hypothetical protein
LEGEGRVGDAAASVERRARSVLAPLPTVGVYGRYEPIPKLTLAARVDYLQLKISDYRGSLINVEASASYRVFPNVGIGAMYRHVDYQLDVDRDDWNGGVAYRFSGPLILWNSAFKNALSFRSN